MKKSSNLKAPGFLRRGIKILVTVVIATAVAGAVIFLNTAYKVPILMYHSIDYNDKITKLSASPESFERQMKFLVDNNYNVISLEKYAQYVRSKEPTPPKTIVITFDDGFYNNYKYAYPVLKKYTLPATIFMIVGKIGTEGYLSWDNLKDMADSGIITIGCHTRSHLWLLNCDKTSLKDEIDLSRKEIEKKIGRSVDVFCYPMGAFDGRSREAVKDSGYTCAVTTNPRYKNNDDIFAMKRIKISRSSNNLFVFWVKASGYYGWFKRR